MNRALTIVEMPCEQIRLGERHRKDLGDLEALAVSISTVGLLHPPVVTKGGMLVCGERRFRAMRDILGWKTVPVIVLEVSSIVEGEYAENEIRKDFTPSERVAIGKALEAEIGKRQGQRTDKELPPDLAEVTPGAETRDLAARRAGFGGHTTYELAKRVVQDGVDELIEAMDTGAVSIHAAAIVAQQLGRRNTIYAGELRPWQVLIPRGVGHGYKVLGTELGVLVYATDRSCNPEDGGIPYDHPGINYDWSTQHK